MLKHERRRGVDIRGTTGLGRLQFGKQGGVDAAAPKRGAVRVREEANGGHGGSGGMTLRNAAVDPPVPWPAAACLCLCHHTLLLHFMISFPPKVSEKFARH